MRIIAVINQKGGVGKTTTSVNFAAGLARKGFSTLLIDLDPQAQATACVGVNPDGLNGLTVTEVLLAEDEKKIQETIHSTYLPHLKLIPASIHLARAAVRLHAENFREQRLKQAIDSLTGFDYIVIDCQPSLDVLPVNAMVAADHFLIPTQNAGQALRGLGDLLDTLQTIKRRERRAWDWRVLLTMVMGQTRVTNEIVKNMLEPIQDHLLETVIPRNEALNRAQTVENIEEARDIFEYDKTSRGAVEYTNLVEELIKIWPK